jgi:hypothetical protein
MLELLVLLTQAVAVVVELVIQTQLQVEQVVQV